MVYSSFDHRLQIIELQHIVDNVEYSIALPILSIVLIQKHIWSEQKWIELFM